MNDEELYLMHYGTKRHSGRYEWGSGDVPYQHEPWFNSGTISSDKTGFYNEARALKKKGMSDGQIISYFRDTYFDGDDKKFNSTKYRAWMSIGKEQTTNANITRAMELKAKGMSNVAIAEKMGTIESNVRNWLSPDYQAKQGRVMNIANTLKEQVDDSPYGIDVGTYSELQLSCSKQTMDSAIAVLKEQGYKVNYLNVEQQGNLGNYTSIKVLAKEDTPWKDINNNMDQVKPIQGVYSNDGGKEIKKIGVPKSIDSSRIKINYTGDDGVSGGYQKDGLMEIRPGLKDINLGDNSYAQVRIAVDDSYYLKGMAVYNDKLPDGVDIVFNTNKKSNIPMMGEGDESVLKKLKKDKETGKIDETLPFGANVKLDDHDPENAVYIVNEDEDWNKWSKNLASQSLSKQSPALAKRQLGIAYDNKKSEFDSLSKLENPVLKKKLLEEFADECDSAATKLKAAPLPRQSTNVILPVPSLKEGQIYAPQYNNGETVALVRYPHGGIFEIPVLTVNNNNKEAKETLGEIKHAVGINKKAAEQLSGADFDGDTVLVIPIDNVKIKASKQLKDLKDWDDQIAYQKYEGMPEVGPKTDGFRKQTEMGKVSNLITDMTLKGATEAELAKAVKHSMVVIDAEKHQLDWKRSYVENDIAYLKEKYQGGKNRGASTLISRASSEADEIKRKEIYSVNKMTPEQLADYKAGKKVYGDPVETYIKPTPSYKKMTESQKEQYFKDKQYFKETGEVPEKSNGISYKIDHKKTKTTKMAVTEDARTLISEENTIMENIYANYANSMKQLALDARKEARATKNMVYDPNAKKVYKKEVDDLNSKLKRALANNPRERQAQMLASKRMKTWMENNPDATKEDIKKRRNRVLAESRAKTGADKDRIVITDKEWEAIQSGAVTTNTMVKILNNTDQDRLRELATPRTKRGMSSSQMSRAKSLLKMGYTQAEVAEALGVSVSTIQNNVEF